MKSDYSKIELSPIGIIHSPFKEPKGTPIQTATAEDVEGKVEVFKEYMVGLKDLNGFSHIILLYHFHLTKGYSLLVRPYMDDTLRGVFATRAPRRPNPIGMSVVRLTRIEENILYIKDVDIVDGTPLLDIKPYVPDFDIRDVRDIGWLKERMKNLPEHRDDGRFI
ncbi:MAG TPA: tRNA (N6-threonylcarbamoyladenosine(37)-N6)-methyltransferase TrmO [Desulfobacteraceae bacterium]|nr:tRNA (N6-threonylcarbamoyladenosine(37)-N6)-methyltransferase TrmO [Desulfobacteraceae bacterium]